MQKHWNTSCVRLPGLHLDDFAGVGRWDALLLVKYGHGHGEWRYSDSRCGNQICDCSLSQDRGIVHCVLAVTLEADIALTPGVK